MKKLFYILVFIISLNAEVIIKDESRTIEGVGTGITRAEAVNSAIIEAVGQLNGVSIREEKFLSETSIETVDTYESESIFSKKINRLTKGKVDSYAIMSVHQIGSEFEATVQVTKTKITKTYKTPGLNPKNRRTIVVVPPSGSKHIYSIVTKSVSSREISQSLSQELISAITQTRKFTVLDRESNRAYANEKALIKSSDASPDELLKLGQVLGADYLLTTKISELNILKEDTSSAIVADMSSFYTTYATIQYRIISVATHQIKWSNTSSFKFEPEGNSAQQMYSSSLKRISKKLTTELIENIYPIKIVDISDNQITINQGSLQIGKEFEVFKLGNKIIDTYTNESLGRTEVKSGRIKIIKSLPKFSIAKLLEGDVIKGSICRTSSSVSSDTLSTKVSNTTMTEAGGVVMPFD